MLSRVIICCLFLFSCTSARYTETRLYFGQSKLDGGAVTEAEWNQFVDKYVGCVFPEGSTVQNATGNWFDTTTRKIISEPSKVIVAFNRLSAQQDRMIDSLRLWYKRDHLQQSVLRVDRKVRLKLF